VPEDFKEVLVSARAGGGGPPKRISLSEWDLGRITSGAADESEIVLGNDAGKVLLLDGARGWDNATGRLLPRPAAETQPLKQLWLRRGKLIRYSFGAGSARMSLQTLQDGADTTIADGALGACGDLWDGQHLLILSNQALGTVQTLDLDGSAPRLQSDRTILLTMRVQCAAASDDVVAVTTSSEGDCQSGVSIRVDGSKPSWTPVAGASDTLTVALDGRWLAVGYPSADAKVGGRPVKSAGEVLLFEVIDGTARLRRRIDAERPREEDFFGREVAISAGTLFIGSAGWRWPEKPSEPRVWTINLEGPRAGR
jgi:hypothetical protein